MLCCHRAVVKWFLLVEKILHFAESHVCFFHWHKRTCFGHRCFNLCAQDLFTNLVIFVKEGPSLFLSFSLSSLCSFCLPVFLSLSWCNQEKKNPCFFSNRPFYWEQKQEANFCRQFLFNAVDIIFEFWIISLNVLMQFVISYADVFQVYLEHFNDFLLKIVFRC